MTSKQSYNFYKDFTPPFPFNRPNIATILSKLRIRLLRKDVEQLSKFYSTEIFTCGNGIRLSVHKNIKADHTKTLFLIPGYLSHHETSYMLSSLVEFFQRGWNIIRINPVDHGDTLPLNKDMYHALQHDLVAECINSYIKDDNQDYALMGFSFGGNYALRIGTLDVATKIKKIVAISPMIDHEYSIDRMQSPIFKKYYREKWQKTFRYKQENWPEYKFDEVLQKETFTEMTASLMPAILPEFTNIKEYFDSYKITNKVTAKLKTVATLITAKNDPVVPISTFKHLENDPHISLLVTKHGGHNGFIENYAFEDFSIKLAIEEFDA